MTRILFTGILIGILSCQETEPNVTDPIPEIVSVIAPTVVSNNDTFFVRTAYSKDKPIFITARVFSNEVLFDNAFKKDFSDDGLEGDRLALDKVFTGILDRAVWLQKSTSQFEVVLEISDGSVNGRSVSLIVSQNPSSGHAPVISNFNAPDTVYTSRNSDFKMTVQVSDAEGLLDIASVTRVNVTGGGSPRPLSDNGPADDSGDQVASDGIYTETVSVSPPPAPGSYLFRVQATDLLGLKSNTIERTIVIVN